MDKEVKYVGIVFENVEYKVFDISYLENFYYTGLTHTGHISDQGEIRSYPVANEIYLRINKEVKVEEDVSTMIDENSKNLIDRILAYEDIVSITFLNKDKEDIEEIWVNFSDESEYINKYQKNEVKEEHVVITIKESNKAPE
mgnify:CR=1 FL=1